MGRRSKKALGFVFLGLLATSMHRGDSGLTEKQYWDAHPDVGRAHASKVYGDAFLAGHTMADAVAHPDEDPYKTLLDDKIYGEGWLNKDDPLTVAALEDACLRRYQEKQATTNCCRRVRCPVDTTPLSRPA